ncbi:serine/threonine-protein kinase [Nonomuraea sp. SYSU D8015]|uniref:serine/threonine-protein kinase n=1 Tax=Nonomuraea sp. SYSU D8015 TaxID=2593644 RepID=UPI001660D4BE|nr:serine/threonine-protein kinase [Nonomuraea sp. SYSU D8015]
MVSPLTPDDPASLGGFRLAGRLGEGGQGVVYLAHSADGEPVAIKLLSTGDRETRARLARELDALESIASFCTARVLDASTDGPRPYVVSEYVDGPSLADRVSERGPLHGGELERLVVGTATALAAIHAAGIVHRDFKPANVLLGPDGPRVVDFGIARAEGAATMTSGLIGTPAYLAPEQIGGTPASPASDVFAWAASMVYAATGTSPFGADTVPAVLHRVLHSEPDLTPLPERLRGVIASCLAKDPARRPTAQQLMVSLVTPNTPPPAPPFTAPPGPPPSPSTATTPPAATPPAATSAGRPGAVQGPPGAAAGTPAAWAGPAGAPAPPHGTPSGTPGAPAWSPAASGVTGPQHPASASTTAPGRRSPSRGLIAGAALAVVALAATVATVLMLNRAPATTEAGRSASPVPPATQSSPARSPSEESSPTTSQAETSSGESSPGATRTQPAAGLKIPAAFEGEWSGHTTSTNPMDPDGAENTVKLEKGESTAAWTEKHAEVECKGTITLTKVERTRLTFSLGQNEGNCIAGTIWLALEGDVLTYTWRDVPGMDLVTQTGKLIKNG